MVVEGVSKLSFQCGSRDAKFCVSKCGSRDAKFCVSTIWLDKLLILNVLYVVANIETQRATSLHLKKSHFDTPSTGVELHFEARLELILRWCRCRYTNPRSR